MNVYLDIESDGILEHITRIHCIGYAIDNQPVAIVDGSDIQPWLDGLPKDATIVGHNVIGFDLPALHKVLGWKWKGGVEDTMLISMMDNPDRVGGHSLDNLAKLVRMEKGDPGGGWDTYTPAMASYCKLDVEILRAVHKALSSKLKAKGDPAKAMYIEHKFAAIFASQGVAGVHVDQKHCVEVKDFIEKEMQDIADKVEPLMPQVEMGRGELNSVTPPKIQFKKNGTPSAACMRFFDTVGKEGDVWRATKDGVTVVLPHHEPLYTKRAGSMKDDAQLKAWMMDQKWEPAFWNYKKRPDKNGKMRWEKTDDGELVKTSPKFKDQGTMCPNLEKLVTEGVFDESIKLAAKWVVLRHRLGLVKGVMSRLRPDGRVCATGFSYGTPTSRVRHVAPVCNIPKADKTVLLGKEMRAMFCAAPDKTLVGVDAAGLEFRCLAHYMGDDDFTEAVVNGDSKKGTDVHTVMQKVCSEYVPSRSVQKNVSYAFLYGAGDKKLGITAGHPTDVATSVGRAIRAALAEGLPKLGELMRKCEEWGRKGRIEAIDGRIIPIRMPHATLNMLLQSCGSITVKLATILAWQNIVRQHLRGTRQVIHMHDEVQYETVPQYAEAVGQCFVDGLQEAGRKLKLVCPLDGDIMIGKNWSITH